MYTEGYRRPILAIVAALNEEEGIGLTIAELRQYLPSLSVLVVDGRSRDCTVKIAREMNADVVLQQGTGKGDALACAFRSVDRDFDYAVLTDGDYTYPAEYLPRMISVLQRNPGVGMVCGNRFNLNSTRGSMRDMFYLGNRILAISHNMLNGVALQDPLTGLRVVRWRILKNWVPKSKGFDIEVELNHHVERRGYGIAEVPIPYRDRLGEKKLKIYHGASILGRILLETIHS